MNVGVLELLLLRMGVAAPLFVGLAMASSRRATTPVDRRTGLAILGLGFLGYYLASVLDFYGLQYLAANLERLILYLYPTFVLLLGWVFFKRSVSLYQWASIALTYIGICLVFGFQSVGVSSNWLMGAMLVGLSTLSYSIYVLFCGEGIPRVGPVRFTALVMLASTGFMGIHYVIVQGLAFPALYPQLVGLRKS